MTADLYVPLNMLEFIEIGDKALELSKQVVSWVKEGNKEGPRGEILHWDTREIPCKEETASATLLGYREMWRM